MERRKNVLKQREEKEYLEGLEEYEIENPKEPKSKKYYKKGVDVEEGKARRRKNVEAVRQQARTRNRKYVRSGMRETKARAVEFQNYPYGLGFEDEVVVGEERYREQGNRQRRTRGSRRGLQPRTQKGRGLSLMSPDEMVERLSLVVGSVKAGNVSDEIFNEASSIIDKLYDLKAINKTQMKKLYKKYLGM